MPNKDIIERKFDEILSLIDCEFYYVGLNFKISSTMVRDWHSNPSLSLES